MKHILDCTLRDGGYANGWNFTDEFIDDYVDGMISAKVDIIELGFLLEDSPSQERFNLRDLQEADIADLKSRFEFGDTKVAALLNMCAIKDVYEVIIPESIDIVRFAINREEIKDCARYLKALMTNNPHVKFTINLKRILAFADSELKEVIKIADDLDILCLYIADTYGSLLPVRLIQILQILSASNKKIGVHLHNNLNQAFANATICETFGSVGYIDTTVHSYGRGGGNLNLKQYAAFANRHGASYNLTAIEDLEDIADFSFTMPEYENFATGLYNIHPCALPPYTYLSAAIETIESRYE